MSLLHGSPSGMMPTFFLLRHSPRRLLSTTKLSGVVSSPHCCMSLVRFVRAARHDVVLELMLVLTICRHSRVVAAERKAGTDVQ